MLNTDASPGSLPLAGCRVIEISRGVAAAYAGRLLATMGADVIMLEPAAGSLLRHAPPLLDDSGGESALFAYLAVGKQSAICELGSDAGESVLRQLLSTADILIDDTPRARRPRLGLDEGSIAEAYPGLVHVSVLPYGASGCKADWDGEEVNLVHAAGEGFLLPNGYSHELFPERAPLKMYGHFAEYQSGLVAAISALSALWCAGETGGQYIDVSSQDAMLLCGAFALQRLGDGSLEHRSTRKFRYGGVFETENGYLELLTLEDRQWQGLVKLLGEPEWALDEALQDPLERSRRGDEINKHVREWMAVRKVEDIVAAAQELGVPAAKYRTPEDVLQGEHERSRALFQPAMLPSGEQADILLAPFQFATTPLHFRSGVPALGSFTGSEILEEARA
ncbi:CaiB/BaiF CoA transferase family protein [Haliea sp. E17]|uniref:CaiB/BaiF CoA transferase family protein n=1 Tax=Haliea sp. E17 TaxID=3401576 RepID=UPI003AAF1897